MKKIFIAIVVIAIVIFSCGVDKNRNKWFIARDLVTNELRPLLLHKEQPIGDTILWGDNHKCVILKAE